jgi:predicted DNA-binding transcriptional regulator AlpA
MTETTKTPEPLLTVAQVCEALQVSRSTLYGWWARGDGPARVRLPNGAARVRPAALREFVLSLEMAA